MIVSEKHTWENEWMEIEKNKREQSNKLET